MFFHLIYPQKSVRNLYLSTHFFVNAGDYAVRGESYIKRESDERYWKSGVNTRWVRVGGAGLEGRTVTFSRDVRGSTLFVNNKQQGKFVPIITPPQDNIEVMQSVLMGGILHYKLTNNGTVMHIIWSPDAKFTEAYLLL